MEPKRQEPVEPVAPKEDLKVGDADGGGGGGQAVHHSDQGDEDKPKKDPEQALKKYKTIGLDEDEKGDNEIKDKDAPDASHKKLEEELKEKESKAEKLIEELEKQKNEHKQILLEQKQVLEEMRHHVDEEKKARAAVGVGNEQPLQQQQQPQPQQQQQPQQLLQQQPQQLLQQQPQQQQHLVQQPEAVLQQQAAAEHVQPLPVMQQQVLQPLDPQQQPQNVQAHQQQFAPQNQVLQQPVYPPAQQMSPGQQQVAVQQPQAVQQQLQQMVPGPLEGAGLQMNQVPSHQGQYVPQVIVSQSTPVDLNSALYQQQLLLAQQQVLQEQHEAKQVPAEVISSSGNAQAAPQDQHPNDDQLAERKEMKREAREEEHLIGTSPFGCSNCDTNLQQLLWWVLAGIGRLRIGFENPSLLQVLKGFTFAETRCHNFDWLVLNGALSAGNAFLKLDLILKIAEFPLHSRLTLTHLWLATRLAFYRNTLLKATAAIQQFYLATNILIEVSIFCLVEFQVCNVVTIFSVWWTFCFYNFCDGTCCIF